MVEAGRAGNGKARNLEVNVSPDILGNINQGDGFGVPIIQPDPETSIEEGLPRNSSKNISLKHQEELMNPKIFLEQFNEAMGNDGWVDEKTDSLYLSMTTDKPVYQPNDTV